MPQACVRADANQDTGQVGKGIVPLGLRFTASKMKEKPTCHKIFHASNLWGE